MVSAKSVVSRSIRRRPIVVPVQWRRPLKNPLSLVLKTCAAGALALMFSANASAGAIFHGTFDPIDFGGFMDLDVPAACIISDGFIAAGASNCGDVGILSLQIQNPPPPAAATDTLTFAPPTISGDITGLFWVSGVLTGVDSSDIGPAGPSGGSFFTNANGYVIDFVSGHFNNVDTGSPQAFLFACGFGCDGRQAVGDPAVVHPFVEVTVPEPGSIALILGGIGAAWFTRRYRRTT